jgi:hypothetical protein
MKVNTKALALASAILWGLVMLLMSLANLTWGSYTQFLQIMSSVYPGYHATRSIAESVALSLLGSTISLPSSASEQQRRIREERRRADPEWKAWDMPRFRTCSPACSSQYTFWFSCL